MNKNLKSILFAVTIAGSITNADAQDAQSSKSSGSIMIGITGGLSSPSGNFTKTDYDNNASGFAGSGSNIGITGTWFFNKSFGISLLCSYHQYSYRGIQNMADGFHESFDVDSASATTRGSNHTVNILVGPYYSLQVSDKFSIDFRALAGLTSASLAGWDVVLTDAGITHPPLTQDVATASTLGMQAGIGFRYNITRQWAVMLNADYFYSQPNFTIVNEDRNANAGREINTYNQPITGLNANITLAYLLKRK
jgi:outer membrane protein W